MIAETVVTYIFYEADYTSHLPILAVGYRLSRAVKWTAYMRLLSCEGHRKVRSLIGQNPSTVRGHSEETLRSEAQIKLCVLAL